MKEISKIHGGENLPQRLTDDVKPQGKTGGVSIFHDLDTNHDQKVDAKELSIDETLNKALETLLELASKGVKTEAARSTLKSLINATKALKAHEEIYNDNTNYDTITLAASTLKSDAQKIEEATTKLAKDVNAGVEVFKRQTYNSKIVLDALGDENHNVNAEKLVAADAAQAVDNRAQQRLAKLKEHMESVKEQVVDAFMKQGENFDKSKIKLGNTAIFLENVAVVKYAMSDGVQNDKMNAKGQLEVAPDIQTFSVKFTVDKGTPEEKTFEYEVVRKIPKKEVNESWVREGDDGFPISVGTNHKIVRGDY